MSIIRLDSIDDPRVADFRVVSDPELMRARRLFVAEGQLAVERLLASRFPVRALLLTDRARGRLDPALAAAGEVDLYLATPAQLRDVTGFRFHRGCLGIGERPASSDRLAIAPAAGRPVVALDHVADPDNIGSIFRHASAFGAAGVVLSAGCADPLYRKAIRTSMGTTLRLPFSVAAEWPSALATLKRGGARLVVLTPAPAATGLETFVRQAGAAPTVLLFGNEGDGVGDATRAHGDAQVRIEIDPAVDSLNVATAAAIVLQRLYATRRRARPPSS